MTETRRAQHVSAVILDCTGEIVRVEHSGQKVGVAATILNSHLERHA